PVLNFLGSKVSAETMNALQKFVQEVAMEKVVFNSFTNKGGPQFDTNESIWAMIIWYLLHSK
ncbi:MAG: hypothetical protein QMD88_09235, partial [Coprothermobacterota bacterium]|nr:hypothetical protein [Coprothermobacterota bacterium]